MNVYKLFSKICPCMQLAARYSNYKIPTTGPILKNKKEKQSGYRPGVAQRVPGS
jgi:hypothetical protein